VTNKKKTKLITDSAKNRTLFACGKKTLFPKNNITALTAYTELSFAQFHNISVGVCSTYSTTTLVLITIFQAGLN